MKLELVDDWRDWWRWWSVRFALISTFCGAALGAYAVLPADVLPAIPEWVKSGLGLTSVLSAGLAAVARPIKQHIPHDNSTNNDGC